MNLTNAEIKTLKKLKDKKYRKQNALFLVEGIKACSEITKKYNIKYTLSSNEKYSNYPNFVLMDFETLKSIATTESPQDIICVCEIPKILDALPSGNSLILDNLQDPGNIGTLIRSAVAFNFLDVYFINCADIFSEKVIRSSMGAIFKINPHFVSADYIIENKRQICDVLVGTSLNGKPLNELSRKKIAVIIGNEGNGVSKILLDNTDINVTLKMSSNVESLNAGVAGSILMYNIFNKD